MTAGEQAQRAAVVAEALTWLGTPYHHHGRLRGVGVDCAMLLAEVYCACGIIAAIDPGHYAVDWHLHRGEELFAAWMGQAGARHLSDPLADAAPQPGDVGLWRFGRTYSHGGIVVRGGAVPHIVHAHIDARRVTRSAADECPLAGRPVRWFTLWS